MDIVVKIAQLILALSILVFIHELGHFLFARLFKIRVDKFYLFFDWGWRIFKFKPKNSDTEYGIGWLPLGGYCKIAGMVDESMDTDSLKKEPQPWEFRSKPAWQRFLVIFGGVFFNILLAIAVYSAVLFTWGEEYVKNSDVTTGVAVNKLAYDMGFRDGDKILAFDGEYVEDFADLQISLIRNQAKYATVVRGGDTITVNIDPVFLPAVLQSRELIFNFGIPAVVSAVPENSINSGSGLQKGDRIVSLNGSPIATFSGLVMRLAECKGDSVKVAVERGGEELSLPLALNAEKKIMVEFNASLQDYYKITQKEYSLPGALAAGFNTTFKTVANYWKELKLIVSPKTEAYKSVGSFITIGSIFPGSWNWEIFWNLTAFLSVMLAVINILPIPALDGGHLLFTVYEMVTGRKPSDKFLIAAQTVGMFLLFAIMILAFGNDIVRLFN